MSRGLTQAEQRRNESLAFHTAVLTKWFVFSGRTMAGLIADIERLQPGSDPTDFMGAHPDLILPVCEVPRDQMSDEWRYAVCRAIQHMAIVRPWRQRVQCGLPL